MSRITITRATVDDLPWVRHLFAQLVAEPSQQTRYPVCDAEELDHFTVAVFRNLKDNPRFGVWLAWRGRKAIGLIGGEIQHRLIGKPHDYAHALFAFVDGAHRRGDVGFRLLEAFATFAADQGIAMMECEAVAGDTRYADAGYPLVTTTYAAPVAEVVATWRAHAHPTAPKANGHDSTAEVTA